jgi:phospholipase C
MSNVDRSTFLALVGVPAVAAALPQDLDKALAIAAHNRSGTIEDVEHIVFLMQENRSFDHYFGTLRGVRGFADPHPVTLPSGRSVWHQPNGAADLLPFRPAVRDLGRTFLPDPPQYQNASPGTPLADRAKTGTAIVTRAQGLSTVATTNEIFPGDAEHPPAPTASGCACR